MKKLNIKKTILTSATIGASLFLSVAPAFAAPNPKATGGVGYTAYSNMQRNAAFSAEQTNTDCGMVTSLTGSYVFTVYGTYAHDINLTQTGNTLSGNGGYPSGTGPSYAIPETITGSVTGNDFTFTSAYQDGSGYTFKVNGSVNPTTGVITITDWSSNAGQSGSGSDWTVTGNASVSPNGCTGKGDFAYSDASGQYYVVKVKYTQVSGNTAWFAGPVVVGNVGSGMWLFAKVVDNGQPGIHKDQIWGSFVPSENIARTGVTLMTNPGDGPFTINSGNLVVH